MAKPVKHNVKGKSYFAWKYEEQTRMKHEVLLEYYKVWATKLGTNETANFFDCYGGCGAYIDVKTGNVTPGSPIQISIEALRQIEKGKKLEVYVSEKDKTNYANLLEVKDDIIGQKKVPKVSNISFEEVMGYKWTKEKYKKEPSFFFIDPFGFSLDINYIIDIMSYRKNEIIVNFMFDHINRFLGKSDLEDTITRFFGTDAWKEAVDLEGDERELKLIEIYKRQLKKTVKYVFPFRMSSPDRDRTYYYLFHLTNNKEGCSIMKSAFASKNYGRVEYLGYMQDVVTIFDIQNIKEDDIRKCLNDRFENRRTTFDQLIDEIIDDTPFLEKDIRSTIKGMAKEGSVIVTPVTSKTGRGLSGEDIIDFIGEEQTKLELV